MAAAVDDPLFEQLAALSIAQFGTRIGIPRGRFALLHLGLKFATRSSPCDDLAAIRGWTVESRSPWKRSSAPMLSAAMVRTGCRPCMASNAEGMSLATPQAEPE